MSQLAMSALSVPGHVVPFTRVEDGGTALRDASILPISVIIAAKNEARNLPACLESVRNFGEVVVVDSQSSDATVDIARSFGVDVAQFYYHGGWPKKRQWALDNLPLRHDWVLLLDADEAVNPELLTEIRHALKNPDVNGYYIGLDMIFLGRQLRHCGATFYKLSLFRRDAGRFECRTTEQDSSMCDMEVHEHIIVRGSTRKLDSKLLHRNVDSLSRYIQKHNEYSNWEAQVSTVGAAEEALHPTLFGTQAQRRRWLRQVFFRWPGSPFLFFVYKYIMRAGFLDGVPGLIYCAFQGIQFFQIKAKLYEKRVMAAAALNQAELESESHVRN
ncbi:MAG TPA: glycosyltransferase family 2 protein [Terriglobales bacterium]|nr:glycosyltransferase family 2 protein [Terriglobales bacterium]